MKTITYNTSVARRCGANGIIKAVLINYIYNYHRSNVRKGAGHPAQISLAEFVFQYRHGEKSLWGRSYIHKVLQDLVADKHINKVAENNMPVYSVSADIAALLNNNEGPVVSFDLGLACDQGIHIAIMDRYLRYVIRNSPNHLAYGLNVNEMAEVNRLSKAQIYRAIEHLEEQKQVRRVKCPVKGQTRALALTLG